MLQRILGMVNYDRVFFPKLSEEAKVLYELLSKDAPFRWDAKENEAFENLKMK
jgi:hypothetical protein